MGEAKRLGQIFIKSQHTSDRAPDLRHFQAVGQADTIMVAVRGNEDLRLMPKAPEADGMNDAIAVALKCVAGTARATARLSMLTAAALFRQAGVGRTRAHFAVSFSTHTPSVLCPAYPTPPAFFPSPYKELDK